MVDLEDMRDATTIKAEVKATKVATANLTIGRFRKRDEFFFELTGQGSGTELGLVHRDGAGGAVDKLGFVAVDCRSIWRKSGKVNLDNWEDG